MLLAFALFFGFMSGSCHLDRVANVEIGVKSKIFDIVIFFNCSRVLPFGAHSKYYKGALIQKRSFLVICTTFRSAEKIKTNIQHYIRHSMLCPNDMNQTLDSTAVIMLTF